MTAQVPDTLVVRDEVLRLCAKPLRDYVIRLPKLRRPRFLPDSTANWAGHAATWHISDGKVWLVDVEGMAEMPDGSIRDASLETCFPWARGPMAATWITDSLRCVEGRMRAYVHAGFGSAYECDRRFTVRRGQVEDEWLVYNPPEALVYPVRPDGSRGPCRNYEPDPFPDGVPVEPWRFWGDPDEGIDPIFDTEEDRRLDEEHRQRSLEKVRRAWNRRAA